NMHTAIVGPSGAGKSTLVKIIMNELSPIKGQVQYKKDIKIGYLSQRPYIFSASLEDNVTMFQNYDKQQIEDVLQRVGLVEKVRELSKDIETKIGDGYEMLSGGEMRRVELSKLLLLNPEVFIFDEPTTGLDIKTEQLIVNTVNQFSKEKTIITIRSEEHTSELQSRFDLVCR